MVARRGRGCGCGAYQAPRERREGDSSREVRNTEREVGSFFCFCWLSLCVSRNMYILVPEEEDIIGDGRFGSARLQRSQTELKQGKKQNSGELENS